MVGVICFLIMALSKVQSISDLSCNVLVIIEVKNPLCPCARNFIIGNPNPKRKDVNICG